LQVADPRPGPQRVVDRRASIGRQLAGWKADLVRALGGDISTHQAREIPARGDGRDRLVLTRHLG